jgi:cytochrome c oxidase subunit II
MPASMAEEPQTEEPQAPRKSRRNLVQMLAIGVVASIIGIAIALTIDWFPPLASKQAKQVSDLFDVLLVASVPIFVLVEVVVLYCVIKFRQRPGQEMLDGPPIHGDTRVEVVWTAFPALLLIGLCTYTYFVLRSIEKPKPHTMVVNVQGQQFTWNFSYPQLAKGKKFNAVQLYLPKDQPVQFKVRTDDVIHDFWVPDFSIKIDAVPGITTSYRVTPNKLGTYPIVCAELCGIGHSTMRGTVHVVTRQQFRAWLRSQTAPPKAPPGTKGPAAAAAVGKQVFTGDAGCGGCHTLADASSSGKTGPDLDQALKGKDVAFIRQSIVDPNAQIAKGFGKGIMPQDFGQTLSKQQLDALVTYLHDATNK